jgi:hypothetical protein
MKRTGCRSQTEEAAGLKFPASFFIGFNSANFRTLLYIIVELFVSKLTSLFPIDTLIMPRHMAAAAASHALPDGLTARGTSCCRRSIGAPDGGIALSTVVVVGTQWGDEGKGKITDFLAEKADVVARYQGGNNAGHTILIRGKKYKLTMIPSGIFNENKLCVIGNGMVINPAALVE